MQFSSSIIIASLVSFITAQTTTTRTSYDPSVLSSASSRALASDAPLIFNVLYDFSNNYNSYLGYMDDHNMVLPTAIGNYFVGIRTVDESSLVEYIQAHSFPFSDFATMVTKFTWYSDIMSSAGYSTLYLPEDFITGTVNDAVSVGSSTVSGSAQETGSSSSGTSSSARSLNSASSSVSSSSSSSSSSASSASSTASSSNAGSALYLPVLSFPLVLISLLL